jgi:hypothetical protein
MLRGGFAGAAGGRERWVSWLVCVLAAIASGFVILKAQQGHLGSDFPAHLNFTLNLIQGKPPPGEFLFFGANALLAGFSTDPRTLELSLAIVLGAAVGAKVWLSIRFVVAERRAASLSASPGPLPAWSAVAAMLCAFAFSLPIGTHHYLGQIPPNVWHNSTTILLMPFALGLFWTTLQFLRTGATRWLWWSVPLVALNLATKPSFVLCLLPAFGLIALWRFRTTAPLRRALGLLIAAVALLAVQSAYVYLFNADTASGSGVVIRPLAVWHNFSRSIPLSLLASLVFPLTAVTLGGAAVRGSLAVRYALTLLVTAVAQYALLAERGIREFEGNFTWQSIVAMWVLFVAVVSALTPWYEKRPIEVRKVLIAVAFLVQVAAGVVYVQYWFTSGTFL